MVVFRVKKNSIFKAIRGEIKVEQMKRHLPRLLSFRASKRKLQATNVIDESHSDISITLTANLNSPNNNNFQFKSLSRGLPADEELPSQEDDFYDDEELVAEIARSEIGPKPTVIRIGDSDDEFHQPPFCHLSSPRSISSDEGCFSMVSIDRSQCCRFF